MGILSVVGTPIGNLGDMTYRAVETLEKADFICAEDTRVTAKLLNYFDIKTPLVSYHEHNAKQVGESILNRIMAGENAAIVTDAGMPCISDPGELLVKLCAENGVKVEVVPGPSAVVSALAISGLDTARFQFEGFLSTTKKQRLNHLASVKNCTNTLIFYEAPHKLKNTLDDLYAIGFFDYLDRGGIMCIEWSENIPELASYLDGRCGVNITKTGDNSRVIEYIPQEELC